MPLFYLKVIRLCVEGGGNRSQAPKIVGIIGLSDTADTAQVRNFILQGADELEVPNSVSSISLIVLLGSIAHFGNIASGKFADKLLRWILPFVQTKLMRRGLW